MRFMKRVALAVAFAAAGACGAVAEAREPKALVIMLDGFRADAVENADAPNLRMLRDGKWRPSYKCAWSLTANTIFDARTVSGPNHVSIATGVTFAKHTVPDNGNDTCDYGKWPSWLVRLVDAKPETKTLFMYCWDWDRTLCRDPRVRFHGAPDEKNAAKLAELIAKPDAPDATMWYINASDSGGHGWGYYPYTTGYFNKIRFADAAVGKVLKAIASRPTFDGEDWMVVVTSDHGGYHMGHDMRKGSPCTCIPLLVVGRNVVQGRIAGSPRNYDTAPTVLAHFGIDVAGMELDGRVVGRDPAAVEQERPLRDGLAAYIPFNDRKLENAVAGGPLPVALSTNTEIRVAGGFAGGCVRLSPETNGVAGVCLKGSERLAFENGGEFAFTVWVKTQQPFHGYPAIVSNKDWASGNNPGVVLNGFDKYVQMNIGVPGGERFDLRPYDLEVGRWSFYAVSRAADGVVRFYQGGQGGYLYWMAENAPEISLATGKPFHLGQDGTGSRKGGFNGEIDEFALWTRSLSHDDVRRIWEAGKRGIELGELLAGETAVPPGAAPASASATAAPIAVDVRKGNEVMDTMEKHEPEADEAAHRADFARFRDECARGAFVIGQASSMEGVRPRAGFQWRKADEVKVRLARGERESVQILVAPNGRDLRGVKVAVEGDMASVEGQKSKVEGRESTSLSTFQPFNLSTTLAATNVVASVVGYVQTTKEPKYQVRLDGESGKFGVPPVGWWPDPILDFQKSCDISGDDVQSFWVRVSCPRDQKAGMSQL